MAYVTIPGSSIEVGDAISKDLWDKVKGGLDDHEDRVNALENNQAKIIIFSGNVLGAVNAATITGRDYRVAQQDMIITDCYIQAYEVGSLSGSLQIDIKTGADFDNTNLASIFTTKPSINYGTASDYDKSTNQAFDSGNTALSAGDVIRFDITSFPTGGVLGKFYLYLVGEVS
jgi:hypothetical protein